MDRVQVGIIGTSGWTELMYLPALRSHPRADLAASIEENVVHGSDSADNAAREIAYFFAETSLCPRTR